MNRIFILIPVFILAAFTSHAQIVIDSASHPTPPTEVVTMQLSVFDSVPVPATGPNQAWDYSSLTDSTSSTTTSYMAPLNPAFSAATRSYFQTLQFSVFKVNILQYEKNDTNGDIAYGYSNDTARGFNLSTFTMHNGDSISFPVQYQITPGEYDIKYPATANSSWASKTRTVLDFKLNLNILTYHYHNASGKRVEYTLVKDTVVGWGKMIIPYDSNGSYIASKPYNALMVKETSIIVDSFYLNDTPVNAQLLGLLQLANPTIAPTFSYNFYTTGKSVPIITFFMDSSFSTIQYENYIINNPVVNSIGPARNGFATAKIYPNPVIGAAINFSFYKTAVGPCIITITNSMGQTIQTMPVNQADGLVTMEVNLPQTMANGLYFYSIAGNENTMMNGKFILAR